jgi:hypothetical protein
MGAKAQSANDNGIIVSGRFFSLTVLIDITGNNLIEQYILDICLPGAVG